MAKTPENMSRTPDGSSITDRATISMIGTDVLSDVLTNFGLTTRLFCHIELTAPWGMAFVESELAHFHFIERGSAWLRSDALPNPLALSEGDLVVVPHGLPYTVADTSRRKAFPFRRLVPDGNGRCIVVQHKGDGPGTVMVCGSFAFRRDRGRPLLSLLPPVLHLPRDAKTAGLLQMTLSQIAAEARTTAPGSETIVSRLTDVLFVQVLRAWLGTQTGGQGNNWLSALADAKVGRALSLLHARPGYAWSVSELAAATGLSRSPFSARFLSRVGETPMRYLTKLRLQKAAIALSESSASIRSIAESVGYDSEAALSKAFSREFGQPPGRYRSQHGASK